MTDHSSSQSHIITPVSLWLLAAVLLFMTGCRGSRGMQKDIDRELTGETVAVSELTARFDSATAGYGIWHSIRVPFSARVDGMGLSLSGTAWLVRDSLIYLSARFLGMEVAVVSVAPDSVTVIDKYHHIYLGEPTAALTGDFPLSIGNLQDLLLGHCFLPGDPASGGGTDMIALFDLTESAGGWAALPALPGDWAEMMGCVFGFDSSDNALAQLDVTVGGRSLKAVYGLPAVRPEQWPGCVFAPWVTVSIPGSKGDYAGRVKWNFDKARDGDTPPLLRIPAECRRVDASKIAAELKTL